MQKDPTNRGDDYRRTIPQSKYELDYREVGYGDSPSTEYGEGLLLVAALPGMTSTAYAPRTDEQKAYADHFASVYATMDEDDVWLIHCRFYKGMSHALIAESEGVTEVTARKRVQRALDAFKSAYIEYILQHTEGA